MDPTCADYCKLVTTNCTGDDLQYKDEATCLGGCNFAKLPAGKKDDTDKNTIGCRLYHAGAAAKDAKVHCPHAGGSGGDICGKYCDNFCGLVKVACAGPLNPYADDAACQAACAKAPKTGKGSDASGDSLQCIFYHAGVASVSPDLAKVHCAHSVYPAKAGDPCAAAAAPAPTCADYCAENAKNCTGDNLQYKDTAACVKFCTDAKLAAGTKDDTDKNTIGCRLYHSGAASKDAKVHCPHAGPTGGDICGKHCDNFCDLVGLACTGTLAPYKDAAECKAACAKAPTTGKSTDTAGDTLQCLTYHVGVAAASPENAKTHCPHGVYPAKDGDPCAKAAAASKEHVVTTNGFAFDPPELQVAVGDTVKFTPKATHNVIEVTEAGYTGGTFEAVANGFATGFAETKVYKADKAGTLFYMCKPHAPSMKGKVIIK
ncbi:MAG: hypothetical protein EXR79_12415 [Myxococcales bacterium]|nr:hypothetical protein [Myxococcales bacterium]